MAGTPLAPWTARVDGESEVTSTNAPRNSRPYSVGVRMKFGEELEGLDAHDDGITFRSPAPIQPGKMVELILCRGSLLVDAVVIQCFPIRDDDGGFGVRARYHQTSQALSSLIQEEILRLTGELHR